MSTKLIPRTKLDSAYEKSHKKLLNRWEDLLIKINKLLHKLARNNTNRYRLYLDNYTLPCQHYIKQRLLSLGVTLENETLNYVDLVWGYNDSFGYNPQGQVEQVLPL